ncbi:MAG: hypothetical protein IPM24_27945 [Bryobacterales bacterium]|jgi:hypothetical protein|nr:hypothetical protein [Bryobacterales bacterium]
MVCPACGKDLGESATAVCPECGTGATGVVKTSAILIAAGSGHNVYRSVDEVPEELRDRLIQSTTGFNSATVIIADSRGRKELARALRSLPVEVSPAAAAASTRAVRVLGLLLLVLSLLLVWLVFFDR